MRISYLTLACALLASAATAGESEQEGAAGRQPAPDAGFRLISFDSAEKDIALGLNYLMPFVEVPIKRKRNAPPRPLVIVNSAAIISCTLVAVSGMAVGHFIRSLGLESIVPDGKAEESQELPQAARRVLDEEDNFLRLFDNFKLISRNASGGRVETDLPSLVNTIESTFLANDINLPVCLLKAVCALTHRSAANVRNGQASDWELLVEAAANWSWLLSWLEQSSALRRAIEAGRKAGPQHCAHKYPQCKWAAPEEQLLHLLQNNVQLK